MVRGALVNFLKVRRTSSSLQDGEDWLKITGVGGWGDKGNRRAVFQSLDTESSSRCSSSAIQVCVLNTLQFDKPEDSGST